MSKRKSYDAVFKLKAVEVAEKKCKEAAAREFKVDPKRIREWCKQKKELTEFTKAKKSRRKCLTGGGRKANNEEMEEVLFSWIADMRGQNLRVSRKMIRLKAKTIVSDAAGFKASKGWLQRFMRRKGLSLRRKTTMCQRTPADCIPKLVQYITHLRSLQIFHKYDTDSTFAMDETACWLEMPSDTTVSSIGERSVPIKTTGHEKDHYTVILTARANGKKLKPYIVFKGKGTRLLKKLKDIPGVIVRFSSNGWMNDSLTIDYLNTYVWYL